MFIHTFAHVNIYVYTHTLRLHENPMCYVRLLVRKTPHGFSLTFVCSVDSDPFYLNKRPDTSCFVSWRYPSIFEGGWGVLESRCSILAPHARASKISGRMIIGISAAHVPARRLLPQSLGKLGKRCGMLQLTSMCLI